MSKINIYFGHALTNATREYRDERERARQRLEQDPGINVLRFIGLTEGGPGDVYDCDIVKCVGGADLFICDLSIDSNGTGIEFCQAVQVCKIPTLALYGADARMSRLVLGFQERIPERVRIRRYHSIQEELVALVIDEIAHHPDLHKRYLEAMEE